MSEGGGGGGGGKSQTGKGERLSLSLLSGLSDRG